MLSDPQFWVAIAFVIFIIAIFNPVKKILTSSLDEKINEIKNSIEEAESLKNETQVTLNNIKERQNEVEEEIKKIHINAEERIKILEKQIEEKIKGQSDKRELVAKSKIDQLVRDINLQIQQNISQTAINATLDLLEKKLNQEEKQDIINKSITELNSILKTN
jgi:F-type H+-transporting ATPase subunit b